MRKNLSFLACIWFICSAEVRSEVLTAENIYREMTNVYSELDGYEDKGVRNIYHYNEKKEIDSVDRQEFQTSYKKSGKFSFEWVDYIGTYPPELNYLKSEGGITHLKTWGDEVKIYNDLNVAISRVTGVTGSVAKWVPKLFLEDVFCPDPNDLVLSLVGGDNIKDEGAYNLKITYRTGGSELVWIDKKTFILKKRVDRFEGVNFIIMNEVLYDNVKLK